MNFSTLRRLPFTFLGQLARRLPATGLVLDAGCGDGSIMRALRSGSQSVIGLEIDPQKVLAAKRNGAHDALVVGSLDHLPFRSGAFDAVMSAEVVEHLARSAGEAALDELRRVSRGTVVVTTPNGEGEEPEEADDNPFQIHRTEWNVDDFRARGFDVSGLGLHWAWKPGGMARRPGVHGMLGRAVSLLSFAVVQRRPELAAGIMAVADSGSPHG